MRIKQIELLGFKSFKDKTLLTFPVGVTAIVGPNGCGKSNVVDALRWVLGEQSSRQLRGSEMGDVVFAGTQGNPPLGMAEVKLVLENTASPTAPLPQAVGRADTMGQIADGWTEMMVSRRYFRSGDSEYFLNNIPCRLRDIVEFFLGTGAGSKAYSIIEQGRVEHLINAKADEIRVLIEEAAGVSLYRSRRLAAERKLERTQDNLARVADLLSEMERRLGVLRRQANKAAQYHALQGELKTVDLTLLCKAYQALLDELVGLGARRTEVVAEQTGLEHQIQQLQAEHARTRAALEDQKASLRASEERGHAIHSALEQSEQRRQFLRQQEQRAADRADAAQTELAAVEKRRGVVDNEMKSLAEQASQGQIRLAEEEAVLQRHEQDSIRLRRTLLASEAAAEELKTELVDLLTQHAQVQNGLAYARRRREEVAERLQVLAAEANQVSASLAKTGQDLDTTRRRATELHERLELGQRERREKTDGLRTVVSIGEELEQELTGARAKQAELRTRLSTLEEMEQGYERYAPGVQSIMAGDESLSQVVGVVAQMLDVPHSYERAVAAVLGEKLEYIVVAEVGDGLTAVEYLRQTEAGHGSFIPLHPRCSAQPLGVSQQNGHALTVGQGVSVVMASAEPDEVTPLLSLLSVEPQCREVVETLLADTFLVPNLQTGLQYWQRDRQPRTFVTLRGEVLTAQGVVSGGSQTFAQEGLLERRREIRDLRDQVEQHEDVVANLVRRRQEAKQSRQELEGELARLEEQNRVLSEERQTLQRRVAQLEGEQHRLLDKQESVGYEYQTLEEEKRGLTTEIASLAARESELDSQRQEREDRLAERQEQVAQTKVSLEHQRKVCDELRVRVAERRERQEGLRLQRLRLQDQQTELSERADLCQTEHRTAQGEAEKMRADLSVQAASVVQYQAELAAVSQEQERRQASCAQLGAECRVYEEHLEQCRAARSRLQEEKTRLEVKSAEKRVSCDHINTAGYDRYEVAIPGVLAVYVPNLLEIEAGEERRQELRNKIGRLGEVNPGAAAELTEVEERYTSLKTQEADIQASIADLQSTIAKLNRESRDRFKETFGMVDVKFRQVYERLVQGGTAQIGLTDDNDLVHSGVEISVQPPGKRLRSLQLLSGGEKALAALSFTFALFLIRPSPFCVLDEVDAPLDDANVDRFNQLVRELSQTTQMVLITHNKRTMEAASTLYGVTMQEPGVSTVVSVSLS